ncbi:MAG: DUF1887 family CARF protein [Bacteroidales bacterium]|nr:DUF1887 family CARF protein [Bacteroidales bacterium]
MIGVSTAQNITNCIPAVQKDLMIDRVLIIETNTAKKKNWTRGIQAVLEKRNIPVDTLDISTDDSNITAIQEMVKRKIEHEKKPVMWNLGGGQKPQQIAVWEIFKERAMQGFSDFICYANQDNTGILEKYTFEENGLKRELLKIAVNLTAKEIFKVFGYEIKNGGTPVFNGYKPIPVNVIPDHMNDQAFRKFFFLLPIENYKKYTLETPKMFHQHSNHERKKIMGSYLDVVLHDLSIEVNKTRGKWNKLFDNPALKENLLNRVLNKNDFISYYKEEYKEDQNLAKANPMDKSFQFRGKTYPVNEQTMLELSGNKYKKASFYFEGIVNQRVLKLLNSEKHPYIYAYSNLTTMENTINSAEYDFLCVTKKGTVVALDAKTFDFSKKDIDARLLNMEKGSGYYRKFYAVLPLCYDDIKEPWIKPVLKLSFSLHEKRLPFFVVNDSLECPGTFWIKQENEKFEKTLKRPSDTDSSWLECKNLNQFLNP